MEAMEADLASRRVEEFSFGVKGILDLGKVQIGKCNGQAQLTDHRHQRFDDSGAAPGTRGDADKRDRLVYVFPQHQIEHRL